MKQKDILLIHLSENGKFPQINDIEGYEESWNSDYIFYGNCLEFKNGILEGAYKTININIHTADAEFAYENITTVTEIHLNEINYIGNKGGKILTTIKYEGQMIDFICDSIIRMEKNSLFFTNPVLTEYELLESKEKRLRFEKENEVYKYLFSKSISLDWNGKYLGSFLPLNKVNLIQIEPYRKERRDNCSYKSLDNITLVVNILGKHIWFSRHDIFVGEYSGDKFFDSISSLKLFLEKLYNSNVFELELLVDSKNNLQYLLKKRNKEVITFEDFQELGVKIEINETNRVDSFLAFEGDSRKDNWDAMTDGQYGDMPDGFDGDYEFMGY